MSRQPKYQTVTVRVPGTSANLGAGFDTLGLALNIWNRVTFRWGGPPQVTVHGEGANELETDQSNLMYKAAASLLDIYGIKNAELNIEAWQEIPLARGLGSSSAAIVSGIFGANALLGFPADLPELLKLAVKLEGHPDNVAPALVGGMTVALTEGETAFAAPITVPDELQFVVLIPDISLSTQKARSVLEPVVPRQDAVFNIGRAALFVAGIATNRPEYLRIATQDRLHQDARQKVFPAMKPIFKNAIAAGAKGVFLSGAGPCVVAITTRSENRAQTIGYEMADAADKSRIGGTFRVLDIAKTGAQAIALGIED